MIKEAINTKIMIKAIDIQFKINSPSKQKCQILFTFIEYNKKRNTSNIFDICNLNVSNQ